MARARGPLTATTPTGEALAGATVAFKEPDGATALAAALYAASSGGSTTTHSTNSKGQLNRFTDYAQRAFYTLNGDTTIWPIDFEVDPADVMAMGPDGVTVTQGYRAVARMRIASVEGKIRDRGGFVASVDAYADGVTINDYTASGTGGDCTAAVTAALAALASTGGTIEFGVGTYKYPDVTWSANIIIRGAGLRTVLMHPPNSSTIINLMGPSFAGLDNTGICDITLDGNYPNNLDFDAGSSELAIRGTDVFAMNCIVKNFNAFGIQFGGTRPVIAYNRILGPNNGDGITSYADIRANGPTPNRYAGRDGLFTPVATTNALVYGNFVRGLRLPGMFIGGDGLICGANHIENCHRYWGLSVGSDPDTGLPHAGGGQFGIAPNVGTGPGNASQNFVLFDNYIGPSIATYGSYAQGIELNACYDGVLDGNVINGAPLNGITLTGTERISIIGGSITACGVYGLTVDDNTSKFTVMGVSFKGNGPGGAATAGAIYMGGTTNHYAVIGCMFEGNSTGSAVNWRVTATGTNRKVQGNVTIDGDEVPELTSINKTAVFAGQYTNASATGHGLKVQAGDTVSQLSFDVHNYANTLIRYQLYGSGESLQRTAATTGVAKLDVTQAAAGNYQHLLGQRNTATIWGIGTNAADSLVFWNAALNAANLTVSDAGLVTARAGLVATAGGLTVSAGQTIMPVGVVGTPSFVFSGTATGLYSSGSSDLDISIAGTQRLSFKTNGDIVPPAGATNATVGFQFIVAAAGPPSGTLTTYAGRVALYYDTTNHKIYVNEGGATWKATAALT